MAYKSDWVAQQHKAWGVVWQLVGKALHLDVDISIYWPYLQCLLVDLV
jgi:hypothetical protein